MTKNGKQRHATVQNTMHTSSSWKSPSSHSSTRSSKVRKKGRGGHEAFV